MKLKKLVLGAVAVMLVCSLASISADAYFTYDDEANGSKAYDYTDTAETQMTEYVGGHKDIQVKNTGNIAVKVRARVYAAEQYLDKMSYSTSPEMPNAANDSAKDKSDIIYAQGNWIEADDGWFYYSAYVEPGESTRVFDIDPNLPSAEGVGQIINVMVVYEAIPTYASWEETK